MNKKLELQKKIANDIESYEERELQREKIDIFNDALKIAIACEWMFFFYDRFMEFYIEDEVNQAKSEQLLSVLLAIPNIIDCFTELMLENDTVEISLEMFEITFKDYIEVKYSIDLV